MRLAQNVFLGIVEECGIRLLIVADLDEHRFYTSGQRNVSCRT